MLLSVKGIRYSNIIIIFISLSIIFISRTCSYGDLKQNNTNKKIPLRGVIIQDIEDSPIIKDSLSSWKRAITAGKIKESHEAIRRIADQNRILGTDNLIPVTRYLYAEGKSLLDNLKTKEAIATIEDASLVSPIFYPAYFLLAGAYITENKLAIGKAVNNLFNGVYYFVHDSGRRYYCYSVILIFLVSSAIIAYFLFLFILFIKHLRILIHDISKFLPFPDIKILSIMLSILIILLPLTMGGVFAFVIAMPIFIWGYLKRHTRALIMMAIPFFLLLPIIIPLVSKGLVVSDSKRYRALESIMNNSYDEEVIRILLDEYKKRPDDVTVNFSLGLIYKKKGDISPAERFYENVLLKEPDNKYVLVNTGNLFFIKEDYNTAVQYYKMALKVDGRLFDAHYNMGVAYSELNDFEKSLREFSIAKEINSEKTAIFSGKPADHSNQRILDLPPSSDMLISERDKLSGEVDQLSKEIWGVIWKEPAKDRILIIVLMFILALYLFSVSLYQDIYSTTCEDCGIITGEIFKHKYQKSKGNKCIRCLALFREGGSMESARREEIKRNIKRYKQRRNRTSMLFNLLIPGAGKIILGRDIPGFFLLIITSFFISGIMSAFTSHPVSTEGLRYILLSNYYIFGLFIIYYIFSNLSLWRNLKRKSKFNLIRT